VRGWIVIAAAATALVIAVGGLGLIAAQVRVLPALDGQLLADAGRHGAVINPSAARTAECWLPLPGTLRTGPLSGCSGVVSGTAAIHALDASGAQPVKAELADAYWTPPCPRNAYCTNSPFQRERLAWVIQVNGVPAIGGYHAIVPDCGLGGATLVFLDASTGAPVLVLSWGHQPGVPAPDFGCGG
jgi:hypothetical protein